MHMNIEAERGEERHEEHIGRIRIINPNRLPAPPAFIVPVVQKRSHHPELNTVLTPQADIPLPLGQILGRDRHILGEIGVHQRDVEPRRQIVQENPERRRLIGGARGGTDVELREEGEEVRLVIESSGEEQ